MKCYPGVSHKACTRSCQFPLSRALLATVPHVSPAAFSSLCPGLSWLLCLMSDQQPSVPSALASPGRCAPGQSSSLLSSRSTPAGGSFVILKTVLKSQVVYSKQPKLGLTQEFVVDCAHALWVVRSIKRLVSLMLLKWFLSDSFIYFMYRMFNENF